MYLVQIGQKNWEEIFDEENRYTFSIFKHLGDFDIARRMNFDESYDKILMSNLQK